MRSRKLLAAIVLVSLPSSVTIAPSLAQTRVNVVKVYDGDTVTLSDGSRVRLIQIDAPEVSEGECYAKQSRRVLVNLLKNGSVTFETDPGLDQFDRYGRRLGYLYVGELNVNTQLVEVGAATPYFYKGQRGSFAEDLLNRATRARDRGVGLWRQCPGTQLRPYAALETVAFKSRDFGGSRNCDANYAGCIPSFPPDLDCTDIQRLGLAPVQVIGRDVHRLDQNGDKIGCS